MSSILAAVILLAIAVVCLVLSIFGLYCIGRDAVRHLRNWRF